VVRVESSVPHFRVQHIDVRQGPLQRLAGVVDLQISTASAASDATLPGVEPERAEQIRALVLARAEADDAV
jgi:membrane protein YdbS with pleckstrin-like domain